MSSPDSTRPAPAAAYRERLRVPLRWWVQGTMLVASFWLALVVAVPQPWSSVLTVIALLIMAGLLLLIGSPTVEVRNGRLMAGRASIDLVHIGGVVALDREATRRQAGVDADARAYLLLRGYISTAVRVDLVDPRDPTPYWLISTRRASALAAAVQGDTPLSSTSTD